MEEVVRAGLHLNVRLKESMHEIALLIIETITPILNSNGHTL